ncbi:MAG TPA: A/G-specific adenine glycosylase [Noviherbaspirillum sp.]|uniref:A/G-specific adenine glycosylase n=1 Tax=Noviherbaspirillum sp. TaxID=1926288 RepID=UPI002B45B1F9|nr:A/G-specific adenine glycosylase [Noviherbaspirillum sp.]HJV87976.1 A/G-specific adenine glycosylase [Noviherbaspirillum sp.]
MKRIAKAPAAAADGAGDFFDPGFSEAVIRWQKQHGRHALPWQNTRDAYRIWLSEIMLQQTQVTAVIPYYQRFLARFPDVASLAAAASEEVMSCWSGLGYYTRARNLHRCAQKVVAEHGGEFPSDPEALAALPGIGRSTAAAIAAFAYGVRAAILDGNVKRVFCRVFGVEGFPGSKPVEDALWRRAVALLPAQGIEAYTQGLMDLGATLCTRSGPSCAKCPLSERCVALATDRVQALPARKPKKVIPEKTTAMLVVTEQDHVLLEQRPGSGIWGGLLSLPEVDAPAGQMTGEALGECVANKVASFGAVASCEPLQPFTHVFTHFRLHVSPYRIRLAHRAQHVAEAGHVWYHAAQLQDAPLPAPVKKLLLAVFRGPDLLSG